MTMRRTIATMMILAAAILAGGPGARAAPIFLDSTLSGAQVSPPTASPATGAAVFVLDDATSPTTLLTAGTFEALAGPATAVDIEDAAGNVIRAIPAGAPLGFPAGATSGDILDVWSGPTPAQAAALAGGLDFLAIRSAAFPGGEIRGQILPAVPEPSSVILGTTGVLAVVGLAWLRRRRQQRG